MDYENQLFKIPQESADYQKCSKFVIEQVELIIKDAIDSRRNRIIINTNLKLGLPMENINKVAGPFVEAWAVETFHAISEVPGNKYQLINVEAKERLNMADVVLQFQKKRNVELGVTAEVDVKATSEDFLNSGKSPNITSYARIRTAYVDEPDYLFVILSLKHRVYSTRNQATALMDGIMEVVAYNAYDLKYLSAPDISYNPALGTGQIQIRDIHYVTEEVRTTWEFCQLLDRKYLKSTRRSMEQWLELARKHGWIKIND
ncbi:MAG: restriction endonuclease [Planctomycetota bacterium]|nr:MAG: restriction endonuclease [Planctomycetota bacterium]